MSAPTRHVALLRGINLGRRNVKSARLREIFEGMGFADVATFIASGNVVFSTAETDRASLAATIESGLREALGYEVRAMIRTGAEIVAVADGEPFPGSPVDAQATVNVAFLREPADADLRIRVLALASELDEFHVDGREIYWRCRTGMSDSAAWRPFEKLMAGRGTVRNANTVRRMADRFFRSP